MVTEAHRSMPSVCNTHTFCSTSVAASYTPIPLLIYDRVTEHLSLGEVFDDVLFLILIQPESERPSRVTHKAKASGLGTGDPGATRGFDLT